MEVRFNNQVIRLGNVKNNQLVLGASPVFIDDKYSNEAARAKLRHGDILITMTGTRAKRDYLFTLCLNNSDFGNRTLFLNQRVGCFRFSNLLSNTFLNTALKDIRLLLPVFQSSTGAVNQANIGVTALKEIFIPLPPLAEQNRIVKRLEQLMQLCDELQYSIQQSKIENEKLLQGALRDALKMSEPQMNMIK